MGGENGKVNHQGRLRLRSPKETDGTFRLFSNIGETRGGNPGAPTSRHSWGISVESGNDRSGKSRPEKLVGGAQLRSREGKKQLKVREGGTKPATKN